jgi:hypothetical protein
VRFGYRTQMLPCQEGLIISINSTIRLLDTIQQKFRGVHTILGCKLNQDVLENTFSRIRGLECFFDHPSPTEFDYRVRLLSILNLANIKCSSSSYAPVGNLMAYCKKICPDYDLQEQPQCEKCVKAQNQTGACCATADGADVDVEKLRYVAGYVTFKLSDTNPELGCRTALLPRLKDKPSWIEILSRCGLVAPSDAFFNIVLSLERSFLQFSGSNGVHTCIGIVVKLVSYMRSNVDCSAFPDTAVILFARLRIIIRMRYTGSVAAVQALDRKRARKMGKFLN